VCCWTEGRNGCRPLKRWPNSLLTAVVPDGVSAQEPLHDGNQVRFEITSAAAAPINHVFLKDFLSAVAEVGTESPPGLQAASNANADCGGVETYFVFLQGGILGRNDSGSHGLS